MAQRNIFVFGSNLAGRHGAGSALEAVRNHGAVQGLGWGFQGNSYAIPTKDGRDGKSLRLSHQLLPLDQIEQHVRMFKGFARTHYYMTFNVVAIGCGLAGYTPAQIGPMFRGCTPNVNLPPEFAPYVAP